MNISNITDKALRLENLSADELSTIYRRMSLGDVMSIADEIRKLKHPNDKVGWQIDRNVNITNVCCAGCSFCNFSGKPGDTDKHHTVSEEEYDGKIKELFAKGGNQLLLQGGLHPKYGLDFYCNLFAKLKSKYPDLKLHALGPPEIAHIARIEKKSYEYVLKKLVESGLDSLPGAGAEILADDIRKRLSPGKPDVQSWIEVMQTAHRMNLPTSATMMFGHIETIEDRIGHLLLLRDLQARKPEGSYGFLSFICWPVQLQGTKLAEDYDIKPVGSSEYVRMIALSRIALNNIDNIQASWLTVGKDTAQICLRSGANDLGSIMIEENVVSAAGADHKFDAEGIQAAVRQAGFVPWLRNQRFESI